MGLGERLPIAHVVERLLIHVIHVRGIRWHFEVDLRVAVLDDRAEVRAHFRVLLRPPGDLYTSCERRDVIGNGQ